MAVDRDSPLITDLIVYQLQWLTGDPLHLGLAMNMIVRVLNQIIGTRLAFESSRLDYTNKSVREIDKMEMNVSLKR